MPYRIVKATELRDGMRVLFADPGHEEHLQTYIEEQEILSVDVLGYCYWDKITHVTYSRDKRWVSFGAHDNNGVPTNRQLPIGTKFIVRFDSDALKREKVLAAVTEAIKSAEASAYMIEKPRPEADPENVVKLIYKILGLS